MREWTARIVLGLFLLLLLGLACQNETPKTPPSAPKAPLETPLLRCAVELADPTGRVQATETTCATLKDPTRLKGETVIAVEADGLPLNDAKLKGRKDGWRFVFEPGLAARLGGLYTRFEAARMMMAEYLVNPAARQALPLSVLESAKEGSFLRYSPQTQRIEAALAPSGPEAALAPGMAARVYALAVIERFRGQHPTPNIEPRMQVAGANTRRSWLLAFAHYVGALSAGRPDYADSFVKSPEDKAWPLSPIGPDLWHYVGETPSEAYRPDVLATRLFAGLWAGRQKLPDFQRSDYDQRLFRWLFSAETPLAFDAPAFLGTAEHLAATLPSSSRDALCAAWYAELGVLAPRIGACMP